MEENLDNKNKEYFDEKQKIFNDKKLKKKVKTKAITLKNYIKKTGSLIKNKLMINKINPNNTKENDEQKIKKVRNPGVDFFRLISMYNIVVNHYFYNADVFSHFPNYNRQFSLIHNFTDWNNNAFILISGIVGYKTNKYSNLIYLWLTVFFYTVGIDKYFLHFRKISIPKGELYKDYNPMIFNRYWYFSSYFGMYLFLPVINKGIASLTKYELRLVVLTTLGIFIFWREYKNKDDDLFHFHNGFSMIWQLTFYLTGAYIGKYRVDYKGIFKYIYCFTCLIIYFFISYLFFKENQGEIPFKIGFITINPPSVIRRLITDNFNSGVKVIQSVTICLFCLQLNFNKYLAKVICFFGPLIFSVYIIHHNSLILDHFVRNILNNQPSDSSFNSVLSLICLKSLRMLIVSLIIDYLRHLLFTLLRIRKILIFIETKMKEKFG